MNKKKNFLAFFFKLLDATRDEDFVGFFYLSTKAKFVVFLSFCRQKFDKNFSLIMHEKLNFGPFYPKKNFVIFMINIISEI